MNILMILSNPFVTDPRVQREAKVLLDNGHKVTVIVWDRRRGYTKHETIDGANIIRIHNDGLMKYLPNDIVKNYFWWKRAYSMAVSLHNDYMFDVVHCHDLDTLNIGVWLKKKLGIKLVFDAHEIFGYMIEKDVPKFVSKYTFRMEKKLVKNVDEIITIDEVFKEYFSGIAKCPVTVVMNCKDLVYKNYSKPKNDFTLVYIGIMTHGRFFPDILDVTKELNINFTLAGKKEGIYYEVEKKVASYPNVNFLGTIDSKDIIPLTKEAHVVLLLVDPTNNNHINTVFNKQFEAMVCGRPIIVTGGTYAADMVNKYECGIVVKHTKESITKAIIKLRDDPDLCETLGQNALKIAIEIFNWKSEKEKLIDVYKRLLK